MVLRCKKNLECEPHIFDSRSSWTDNTLYSFKIDATRKNRSTLLKEHYQLFHTVCYKFKFNTLLLSTTANFRARMFSSFCWESWWLLNCMTMQHHVAYTFCLLVLPENLFSAAWLLPLCSARSLYWMENNLKWLELKISSRLQPCLKYKFWSTKCFFYLGVFPASNAVYGLKIK